MIALLPRLVARIPASIHTKLLTAFIVIVGLLLFMGTMGFRALAEVNHQTQDIVGLQRKIAAYRQLQHDTTGQLYAVAMALIRPSAESLEATLRQLNQSGYDLDRLQFVAQDEAEVIREVRADHAQLVDVVGRVVDRIRHGDTGQAFSIHVAEASPLADRLERNTNQLVNRANADMAVSYTHLTLPTNREV